MSETSPEIPPAAAVAGAIHNLVVARLGRAFIPLGLVCLVGLREMLSGVASGWRLALGAPITSGAMLSYGMRVVQRAFGRPVRPWMTVATAASLVPPAFGLYVFGWTGLREVAGWKGLGTGIAGILLAALGAWVLHAWLRLLEVRRLADVMTAGGFDTPDASP